MTGPATILTDVEIVRALHQYTRRKSGLQHLSKVPINLLCQTIDLIDRLAQDKRMLQTRLDAGNREARQAEGKHPAPCARHCEAPAFQIEIRRLTRLLQEKHDMNTQEQERGAQPPGMDFGDAIRALKRGERVARAGWNGKGMWLALVQPDDDRAPPAGPAFHVNGFIDDLRSADAQGFLPTIAMRTATGQFVLGWLASQTDMLAEDWIIVGEEA